MGGGESYSKFYIPSANLSASAFTDGPSSTIGNCIMSALSIPPSQKANNSIGLESIHNYANVVNPITFVNTDQYSVVAIYTETEASEADQELRECAEMQIQTDFYEEEIVTVSVAGAAASGLRPEETCEPVDVAKALDTLTKAFALKKENISQEGLREKSKEELGSGSAPGEEQTHDIHGISDQTDNMTEEEIVDPQPDVEMNACARLKDNLDSLSVHEEMAVYTHGDPVFETQQTLCSDSLQPPSPTQSSASFSLQELGKVSESSSKLPVMYENKCGKMSRSSQLGYFLKNKCFFLEVTI